MRPPVSIIVPFKGNAAAASETAAALARLSLGDGDEIVIADNNPEPTRWPDSTPARILAAGARTSSYYARNRGARVAANEWLLFMDADCVPPPRLLDDYLRTVPAPVVGILAGEVCGAAEQRGRLARWARSRRGLFVSHHQESGPHPAGITGNLLVRRTAWEAMGGFDERLGEAADLDFCWRAQSAGWELAYTPRAVVSHRDPERFGQVLRQGFRYGIGLRSLRRRYGASAPAPGVGRAFLRGLAGAAVWPLAAQPERGLFKLIDALVALATGLGYALGDNRTPEAR